ncbi:MAG: hypothetical protein V7L11_17655 [Nostoc sp.]|uniref:hypothetical protein n=1 Tax=Nostoc sp. TaxID=1180 RepID=UPI002FFA0F10
MANGLVFVAEELFSKVARSKVASRVIEGYEITTTGGQAGGGNILQAIFSGFSALVGFIIGAVGDFISFSLTELWTLFVVAEQYIWNFNWNSSDVELDATIKGQYQALAGQLGITAGQAFGYIVGGFVPGTIIFAFNEPLGAQVLMKVSDKFAENFIQNLGILCQQALNIGVQILIAATFKNVRKLLKTVPSALIAQFFGQGTANAINAWGSAGSKPWSFAIATKEFVDNTFGKEGMAATFVNQFLLQANQSFIEAGYVIANSVDTYLAHQALANQQVPVLGSEKYVEITYDKSVPTEKIVLGGQEEVLKGNIVQTIATQRQFNGRDLGIVYGQLQSEIPERRYRPEVVLKFYKKQTTDKTTKKVSPPLSMQISFRLMDKSVTDFATNKYALKLAELIYEKFAASPFKINKGVNTFTYGDFVNGFQFKLDVDNIATAERVIEAVISLTPHTFNLKYLRKGSSFVEPQGIQEVEILGVEEVLPTNNKVGTVTFTHAYLNVGTSVPPINLVDITGKKRNVIYKPPTPVH